MKSEAPIELIRLWIPSSCVISDNSRTHFRAHQAKISRMRKLTLDLFDGLQEDFSPPTSISLSPPVILIYELWKASNRIFDIQNYGKTFKEPLDALVEKGVLPDDNWRNIEEVRIIGGGKDVYPQRKTIAIDDTMPETLTAELMRKMSGDKNGLLIRILGMEVK